MVARFLRLSLQQLRLVGQGGAGDGSSRAHQCAGLGSGSVRLWLRLLLAASLAASRARLYVRSCLRARFLLWRIAGYTREYCSGDDLHGRDTLQALW